MLGLLARVVIGVIATAAVGGTAYGIYKLVTRETVKEEVKQNLQNQDLFKEAFAAKVKSKSNEEITLDILDSWDVPITEMNITGDEISSDIQIGDKILL